ncbi:MAG: hypothetical protein ACM3S1_07580 [Hyphomicrobiales bacterium]
MIRIPPVDDVLERSAILPLVLLAAAGAALAGVSMSHAPMVPAALAGVAAVVIAAVAYQRLPWVPVVVIVAVSALAVAVFLPASAGDEGQRAGLERYGAVSGAAVMLAAGFTLLSRGRTLTLVHPASATLDRLMLAFAALALMAGTVGFASGNSLSYLAGDVYRIVSLPLIYLVTVHAIEKPAHLRVVLIALAICIFGQHLRDAYYAATVFVQNDTTRVKSVFWIQNLVGLLAFVILAFEVRPGLGRMASLYSAAFLFGVGLSRGFRTYILTLGLLLVVPLLTRPKKALGLARGASLAVLLLGPAVILGALLIPSIPRFVSEVADSMTHRVQLASNGEDASASERSLELSLVKEQVRSDPMAALIGRGAGTVYQLPLWASPYALQAYADDQGRIHNVHNSYGSMVLRTGVGGLIAIVALFALAIRESFRLVRRWDSLLPWFPFLAIIAYAGASPFFYFVPGDVLFAIALGMVGAAYRLGLGQRVTAPGAAGETAD